MEKVNQEQVKGHLKICRQKFQYEYELSVNGKIYVLNSLDGVFLKVSDFNIHNLEIEEVIKQQ